MKTHKKLNFNGFGNFGTVQYIKNNEWKNNFILTAEHPYIKKNWCWKKKHVYILFKKLCLQWFVLIQDIFL